MAGEENSLKRKLLGAAVLLALSVIFLPLLLDGAGSESRFRRVENVRQQPPRVIGVDGLPEVAKTVPIQKAAPVIGEKPASVEPRLEMARTKVETELEPPEIPQPLKKVEIKRAEDPSGQVLVTTDQPPPGRVAVKRSVASPPTVAADQQRVAAANGAWIIQAASFADEFKALSLRDRFRDRGYPSFVKSVTVSGTANASIRYRVKVGPLTDQLTVAQRKREIERMVGGKVLVRPYE